MRFSGSGKPSHLILVVVIFFAAGTFLCIQFLVPSGYQGTFAIPSTGESYPEDHRSRAEIVGEMQRLGAVRERFSEWYVSTDGTPSGSGTVSSPLDLATALAGVPARIRPGDIVWIRGGRYPGSFTAKIQGAAGAPIHFRSFPGERVVIDKKAASREQGTLNVRGSYLWFWDLEIANSFPARQPLDPDGQLNPWRGSGINVWAPHTKYINLIVRDNGHGFGLWDEDGGTEIYGCLIFNNGNNKKEHGVYAHNKDGTQTISDNIIFNNAGYGLHIYANSARSSLRGFEVEGNVIFNNGALTAIDQVADQILVGGVPGVAAERITLRSNYVYNIPDAPTSKNRGIRLGYENETNGDARILDNYIVSKVPLKILWWANVEVHGNTIVSSGENIEIETPRNYDSSMYRFAANKYRSTGRGFQGFILNGARLSFEQWKNSNKFDESGRWDHSSGVSDHNPITILRPNKYDSRKAIIVVIGARPGAAVKIDLNSFLKKGDSFELRDAQNIFEGTLSRGVFDGANVALPLATRNTTLPVGQTERMPVHTGIEFSVLLIYNTGRT